MNADSAPEDTLPNYEVLRQWGFAQGSYWCYCSECGKQHTADKRAWRCLACAEGRANFVSETINAALEECVDAAVAAARAEERERLLNAARELKARDHHEVREAGSDYCAGVNDVVQALESAIRETGDE